MLKLVLIVGALLIAVPTAATENNDKKALLALHQEILDAHKNIGLEAWLDKGVAPYVSANRGVISYPSVEDRKTRFRSYIGSTTFIYYRDMVPPIVRVSTDGTLGWVIVQVQAQGVRAGKNYSFQSAWIELYEKRAGQWVNIGNVSNFKPNETN